MGDTCQNVCSYLVVHKGEVGTEEAAVLAQWISSLTLHDVYTEAILASLPLFAWGRGLSACSPQRSLHVPGEAHQYPCHTCTEASSCPSSFMEEL